MRARTVLFISALTCLAVPAGASTVYRCERDGVPTFSDHPCDANAVPHVSSQQINTYTPPALVSSKSPARRAARATRSANGKAEERRLQECAHLQAGLQEIRSHMRRGYGVSEGERLRERQAKLQSRRREQHCR